MNDNPNNPNCDFDCWTGTQRDRAWLVSNNATLLKTEWGFEFWENPIYGDEAPVLATRRNVGDNTMVWNTQDFDLPVTDPEEAW